MKIAAGDRLPTHIRGPVTRTMLALYAGGSGDHSSVHLDIDIARAAGYPDVIVHGMLSMAYMGQMLTTWVPQSRVRRWDVRFTAPTPVGATVTCDGSVSELLEVEGERCAWVTLAARIDDGTQTLAGRVLVAIGDKPPADSA